MELAERSLHEFERELLGAGGPRLPSPTLAALHSHYLELRRWAPKVDLIGPGAAAEIIDRHYVEALHALAWLPEGRFRLLDVGSGAGFPGFVLAAARPDADVWLAEPRSRRAAFLSSAARKAGLGVRVVAARVAEPLDPEFPEQVDLITMRALRVDPPLARALGRLLAPGGRLLVWSTGPADSSLPGFGTGRSRPLPGSRDRAVHEYLRIGVVR